MKKIKKILKKIWVAIKDLVTTWHGFIVLLITFLLFSGIAVFTFGYLISNSWLVGFGWGMFTWLVANPYDNIIVATLLNKYIIIVIDRNRLMQRRFKNERKNIKFNKKTSRQ